ncbi:MAG TPA: long-chain fatty acid--CoA ligase [Bacteroidetes bacterium]|nr:long-chain fatty acid--CoA ligase [Bacteroidota bacterium]HEX03629.1 long-chain fatty acid--CoA ligase [Bacteroidota bacterium]
MSESETSETTPSSSEAASVNTEDAPETSEETSADNETTEPVASLVAESSSSTDSVQVPSPLRRLRFALCAGAHSDLQTLSNFANSLGCPVVTAYGASQASGIISINPAHFDPSCPDSVGRVISGLEVSIRDDDANPLGPGETGEIWVRGPNVVSVYSNGECGSDDEGWFATSDLGRLDENHWLYLVSRKEDRIARGGFPIYPVEVESVIANHEGVRECAVVGRHDPRYGQEVIAFIVNETDQAPSDSTLREFCKGKLPNYKTPTVFKTIDQLPRSENRFILRRELRESLHS